MYFFKFQCSKIVLILNQVKSINLFQNSYNKSLGNHQEKEILKMLTIKYYNRIKMAAKNMITHNNLAAILILWNEAYKLQMETEVVFKVEKKDIKIQK